MRKLATIVAGLVLLLGQVLAQTTRTVTGKVTDSHGLAVPSAAVQIKGTKSGTTTNAEGNFTITAKTGDVLVITSAGYKLMEVKVGEGSTVNAVLQDDVKNLSEVVVNTAVGIRRTKNSMGVASTTIRADELTDGRATNVINGLTGKAPGLQIGRSSGGLNTATRITMRGQRSFNNNDNQPIFVIDGVPISNRSVQPSASSANQVDVGSRIGDLNPDDIESVTILNGPNAAALYGSLASNGAIIITTKTGKMGGRKKMEVTVNSGVMFDKVQKLPKLQNQFGSGYDGVYDEIENTNWGPVLDGKMVQSGPTLADGSKLMIPFSAVPDNAKDFFNTGTSYQNSVSFNGGADKSSFYGSFSDVISEGVIPMDKFRRTTLRLSGQTALSNKFTLSGSIAYNRNKTNTSFQGTTGSTGVYNSIMNVSRQIDLKNYKDWRNYKFATPDGFFDAYYPNPYYALENNRFNSYLDRFLGNFQVGFAPYSWLNVTYRLGTDINTDNRKQTFEKTTYTKAYLRPADAPGGITEDNIYERIINSDLLITLKKDLNKDFSGTLVLLQNVYQRNRRTLTSSASAISIPSFFNLSNRVGELGGGESSSVLRQYGFAGDFTLDFRKYLFLNATLRNDVASSLPKENRSYWYPSVSLSYILTQSIEALKGNDILSYAKLRASWARVGSNTDPYNLIPTFAVGNGFPYGTLAGYGVSNTTPDPMLQPEFTNSFEAGAELNFFKDKFGLDVTYYNTKTSNQIATFSTAASTGYTGATLNGGVVTNKGIEIALRGAPFKNSRGFGWSFNISYTHNTSNVESLYGGLSQLPLGSGDPVPTAYVNQPFPVLVGTAFLRDPQGRVIVGANGNPQKDPTLRILGQVNPKDIIGLSNTFTFKQFSLTTVFDYRTGNSIYSGTKNTLIFTGSTPITTEYNRETFVYPNSVIQTSPGVYAPNTTLKTSDGGFDFWYGVYNSVAENSIVDAAFLKLREVSLTYDLPQSVLRKTPFGRASFSIVGSNILLWTPKSNIFIDPEANIFGTSNSQGREFANIPSTRTFGFNLSLTF